VDSLGWSWPVALMRLDVLNFGLLLEVAYKGLRGRLDSLLCARKLVTKSFFEVGIGRGVRQNSFDRGLVLLKSWQDGRPHSVRLVLVQAED